MFLHIDNAVCCLSSLVYLMQCVTVLREQLTVCWTVKVILQMQLLAICMSPILFLWIFSLCVHFLHTDIWCSVSADSVKDVLVEKTGKQTNKSCYNGSSRETEKSETGSIFPSHTFSYPLQREEEKGMRMAEEALWVYSRLSLGHKVSSGAYIFDTKKKFRKSILIRC